MSDAATRETLNRETQTRETLTRTEKFTVALFSSFATLVVLPGLVFSAIAIFSTGVIDLSH